MTCLRGSAPGLREEPSVYYYNGVVGVVDKLCDVATMIGRQHFKVWPCAAL